ncbi:MAG: hypothetical protein PUI65_05045 [Prevotella sp.]|nr:hypothetical protein [Prevotella sp.]
MNTLDKEHVRCVVNTIFSQLLHTTPIDVINSWGISKMHATQVVKKVNGEDFTMAALVMQVNGFQFKARYILLWMKALTTTVSMVKMMAQPKSTIMI